MITLEDIQDPQPVAVPDDPYVVDWEAIEDNPFNCKPKDMSQEDYQRNLHDAMFGLRWVHKKGHPVDFYVAEADTLRWVVWQNEKGVFTKSRDDKNGTLFNGTLEEAKAHVAAEYLAIQSGDYLQLPTPPATDEVERLKDELDRAADTQMAFAKSAEAEVQRLKLENERLRVEIAEANRDWEDLWTKFLMHGETINEQEAERERYIEALTPSGDTKRAYLGEIRMQHTHRVGVEDEDGEEHQEEEVVNLIVSWDTIKEVMAMIKARATRATQISSKDPTNA